VKGLCLVQVNEGFHPKFCFTVGVGNMNMHSRLFTREEKETKRTLTKNGWSHAVMISASCVTIEIPTLTLKYQVEFTKPRTPNPPIEKGHPKVTFFSF
jgi:hypothetical protein